jgi:NADH-quinone oxidoreductase subunit H
MSWAVENWGVNLANVLGIVALFIKMRLHFPLHVGEMDYPRFRYDQLMHLGWDNTIIYRQYHHNRNCNMRAEIAIYLGF